MQDWRTSVDSACDEWQVTGRWAVKLPEAGRWYLMVCQLSVAEGDKPIPAKQILLPSIVVWVVSMVSMLIASSWLGRTVWWKTDPPPRSDRMCHLRWFVALEEYSISACTPFKVSSYQRDCQEGIKSTTPSQVPEGSWRRIYYSYTCTLWRVAASWVVSWLESAESCYRQLKVQSEENQHLPWQVLHCRPQRPIRCHNLVWKINCEAMW
jgi:hypothetical protein